MSNLIKKLTIENFLSFNTRQVIDFTKDHIGCLVGHNGSGKTNLLLVIEELCNFYLNPNKEKRTMGPSFDQQEKPIFLSIDFSVNNEQYCYTIEGLQEENTMIKEELRNGNGDLVLDMELRSSVGKLSEIEKERLRTYSIDEVGIFYLLSRGEVKIQNRNINEAVNSAKNFFQSIIFIGRLSALDFDYEKELYENKETKDSVLNFINKLDYEIEDIVVEKMTNKLSNPDIRIRHNIDDERASDLYDALNNAIMKVVQEFPNNQKPELPPLSNSVYVLRYLRRAYLEHPISINLESKGVRRLIMFLTWIYAKKDCIILVDELEAGFHELLVLNLIKEVNKEVNQFIFTSHLLELMTRGCLIKKQIFSIAKENGQTVVYSLSEIKNIRDDRHSLKNLYRAGQIPGYPISSAD